jgi:hypothetical protein
MNEPTLLVVKPGSVSKADKAKLSAAGVIVLEQDDPTSLRLLKPACELTAHDLLLAAMRGVAKDSTAKQTFAENFTKFLEAAWARSNGEKT